MFELFDGEFWGFIFVHHKGREGEISFHGKTKIYIRFRKSTGSTESTESHVFTQHL